MIRAIIFDLDNTLIDFFNFKNKCLNAAVDAMISAGLKMKKKKTREIIWKLYKKFGWEYKYIFQEFLKKVSGRIDYRILAHALIAYRKKRQGLLMPYPDVKKTLAKLKKQYKLALISDAPGLKVWIRLASMNIDRMFDVVMTFDDSGKRKPHKLPFKMAVKKLKVKPGEILMVGDSIRRDMEGAKALGMKTALASYGRTLKPRKKPAGVDFMLKKFSDLLKVVKK